MAFIAQARVILTQRDQIASEAAAERTTPPSTLRTAFERSGIVVASAEATGELAVLNELADARQAQTDTGGAARAVGLLGADPGADLAAAREEFSKGDLTKAMSLATRARTAWQTAIGAGEMRIFGSLCVFAGGLLLFFLFAWGRGDRQRARLAGAAAADAGGLDSGQAGRGDGAPSVTGRVKRVGPVMEAVTAVAVARVARALTDARAAGARVWARLKPDATIESGVATGVTAPAKAPPKAPTAASARAADATADADAGGTAGRHEHVDVPLRAPTKSHAASAKNRSDHAPSNGHGDALHAGRADGRGYPAVDGEGLLPAADATADADTESAYELLQRGHALLRDRHNAQAAVVLERAARLERRKGSILEALGRAYFNSGQHARAAETFEALLEIDPSAHYGHFALGLSFARLGRPKEARTHLRMAAALDPASETYRKALDKLESTIA
jgi:tetratricopeptide (TPR) repeat protein